MKAGAGQSARAGSLAEVPVERLLFEAFLTERTCALELRKRQIRKTLLLDRGAPIECVSNLRHETLGQFLLSRGRISGADFKDSLSEAAARQVRIGEILLERKLLEPAELAGALRQNLAFKLLECFTWTDGEYRIEPWIPEPGDVAVVEPTRVIFTGISKFVPQARVAAALGSLLEGPLAATAQTRVALGGLRMSPSQQQLFRQLRRPTDGHALFQDRDAPRDEIARTLYAGSVMGLLAPADAPPGALPEPPASPEVHAPEEDDVIAIDVDTSSLDEPEPEPATSALRDEIATEHRELAGKSALELFGLPAGATHTAIRARYRELCTRYGPEPYEEPALAPAAEMAAELLHAATTAYEELCGRGRETDLPPAAEPHAAPPEPAHPAEHEAPTISPDPRRLAGEYARQARERMASGNFAAATGLLALALRSDPGNRTCRLELAYARYREFPDRASESIEELEGLLKTAPGNALAHLYAAEVSHAVEDFERAAAHFRNGCALWERERA